jgi:hypothetical protein
MYAIYEAANTSTTMEARFVHVTDSRPNGIFQRGGISMKLTPYLPVAARRRCVVTTGFEQRTGRLFNNLAQVLNDTNSLATSQTAAA